MRPVMFAAVYSYSHDSLPSTKKKTAKRMIPTTARQPSSAMHPSGNRSLDTGIIPFFTLLALVQTFVAFGLIQEDTNLLASRAEFRVVEMLHHFVHFISPNWERTWESNPLFPGYEPSVILLCCSLAINPQHNYPFHSPAHW